MRLHYHTPRNWMNDPNGLCQVDGWYHLYYQYNPHGLQWGDMHWGHARSRDLYTWEQCPIALAPDAARREQHCFSGSCCLDAQGKPHFFYTSIGYEEDGRTSVHGAQQWMAEPADPALMQLVQTDAYALLEDMHGDITPDEWRDPCVVPYQGGYLMVLGGRVAGHGCVLLYTSDDMLHWNYRHILAQSELADDVPWECPNLFFVDGKAVIFYSPCKAVQYQVGTLDEALRFHPERTGVLDPAGFEGYYAPQVFRDAQGRSILMGWMPECDGGADVLRRGWNGCMAMPRELRIVDGDLHASLLDGWQRCCDAPKTLIAQRGAEMSSCPGRHYILQSVIRAHQTVELSLLCTRTDGVRTEETLLRITAGENAAHAALDRSRASLLPDASRKPLAIDAPLTHGEAMLTVIVDDNAVEVGLGGRWLSAHAYPQQRGEELFIRLEGGSSAQMNAELYRMR